YKAEFLAHHYAGRVRPAAHYSMGWLPLLARLVTTVPGLATVVNLAARTPGLSSMAKRAGGIDPRRTLPRFAGQTFTTWHARRRRRPEPPRHRPGALPPARHHGL